MIAIILDALILVGLLKWLSDAEPSVIGAGAPGIGLSMFYGVELRRCFLIAGVYMVLSIIVNIGVNLLFHAATSTGN